MLLLCVTYEPSYVTITTDTTHVKSHATPVEEHGYLKPQSHQIVRFVDRTIGCDLVSYDRSAMFAAISFYDRTLWFILYDWL